MTRHVTARTKLTWCLLFVSAGEVTLADHVASAGKATKAGAEVRLLNIPAEASDLGLFENIGQAESAAAFSRQLREAAKTYYGTPLIAWLRWLTEHPGVADSKVKAMRTVFLRNAPRTSNGEIIRAAERFSLLAAAGELAIQAGVLPWDEGQAHWAASTCFKAWLGFRGSLDSGDDEQAIRRVRVFIEQHGASRFQSNPDEKIINRAGFLRSGDEGPEYLVLSEVFRQEICGPGFEPDRVARALDARGILGERDSSRWNSNARIPALGNRKARVYVIKSGIMSPD